MPSVQPQVSLNCWVVLPTYCEAENLRPVVDRICTAEQGAKILIVDDNSPDGTGQIAEELVSERSNIHLLSRPEKKGLGAAYLDGFVYVLAQNADAVVTMDCDLSHDPASIPQLISQIDTAGCVVGSRYVLGGRIENWPIHRRALSVSANWFVRTLFDTGVKDCTSGFRAYRRSVVEEIVRQQPRSEGYSFQVEALRVAASGPLPVVESAICFVERAAGKSKMGLREVLFGAARLISLRLRGVGK